VRILAAYVRRPKGDTRYAWSSPSHVFQAQERERQALRLLTRHRFLPLASRTILEVGCGSGSWIRQFIRWGAAPEHISGLDLRPEAIAFARHTCPATVRLECGTGASLPFADESFDLVLQSTVFTSVLDPTTKQRIACEMMRVLKQDGLILWYDFLFDNPRNPDVRGVGKREIQALFAGCRIELRRITLAAPLARRLVPRSWLAGYVLGRIPLLCTHYLGAIRKASP
jgi:ubiquinone/menaquinone biosynthesis C-methylase UbiE